MSDVGKWYCCWLWSGWMHWFCMSLRTVWIVSWMVVLLTVVVILVYGFKYRIVAVCGCFVYKHNTCNIILSYLGICLVNGTAVLNIMTHFVFFPFKFFAHLQNFVLVIKVKVCNVWFWLSQCHFKCWRHLSSSGLITGGEILELMCTSYIRQYVRSEAMIGLTKEWSANR
jgi:hypothetical protein